MNKSYIIFISVFFICWAHGSQSPLRQKIAQKESPYTQLLESAKKESLDNFRALLKGISTNKYITSELLEQIGVHIFINNEKMSVLEVRKALLLLNSVYFKHFKSINEGNTSINILNRLTFPCYYGERIIECSRCNSSSCCYPSHSYKSIEVAHESTTKMREIFSNSYLFKDARNQITNILNKESLSSTIFS